MEGQTIIVNGKNYLIQSIDEELGLLKVANVSYKSDIPVYIQDRHFEFDWNNFNIQQQELTENLNPKSKLTLPYYNKALIYTTSKVLTEGYTALFNGFGFNKGDHYYSKPTLEREDTYTECLLLSYKVNDLTEEKLDRISVTLSILIQETLRTLFPNLYQYLNVIPIVNRDVFIEDDIIGENLKRIYSSGNYVEVSELLDKEFNLNIIIVEDSLIDIGAVQTLYKDLDTLYSILKDYLEWFLNDQKITRDEAREAKVVESTEISEEETEPNNSLEELEEESQTVSSSEDTEGTNKEPQTTSDSKEASKEPQTETTAEEIKEFSKFRENATEPFLFYGQEQLPKFLDLETTYRLLKILDNSKRKVLPTVPPEPTPIAYCSFCGEPINSVEFYAYDDGRISCQHCHTTRIMNESELIKIYQEIRQYFYENFNMDEKELPRNIKVKFKSADSIRRRIGTQPDPYARVLGFANRVTNELWVETGAPEMNIRSVLAHELTHIWQYRNLNMDDPDLVLEILEGHSSFVEIEYYKYMGHLNTYQKKALDTLQRDDEYGNGYKIILAALDQGEITNPFEMLKLRFGKE